MFGRRVPLVCPHRATFTYVLVTPSGSCRGVIVYMYTVVSKLMVAQGQRSFPTSPKQWTGPFARADVPSGRAMYHVQQGRENKQGCVAVFWQESENYARRVCFKK